MNKNFIEKQPHFTFNRDSQEAAPGKHITFKVDSLKSIGEDKSQSNAQQKASQKNIIANLPLNFFHSPGEYNKMLIRCGSAQTDARNERQIGIIRNLQFINQQRFEEEKQKRSERVKNYCNSVKKHKKQELSKSPSVLAGKCSCCCCDSYCLQCAKASTRQNFCEEKECQQQEKYLIDIQAMKRKMANKQQRIKRNISDSRSSKEFHRCCNRTNANWTKVEELIKETLIRQIEKQRIKNIQKLTEKERQQIMEQFNEAVRRKNRSQSAPRHKEHKEKEQTKQEIRQAYWNSIKDIIKFELSKERKDKSLDMHSSLSQFSPQKMYKLSAAEMKLKRIKLGKKALEQERKNKMKQQISEKMRYKKLLAIKSQQTEIIKKCRLKKFKPTESLISQAFV